MSIHARGFASMSKEQQHEIASMGGRAAHRKGTAHQWTREEAREAGRKATIAKLQKRIRQNVESEPTHDDRDDEGGSRDRLLEN